jgi:hypothetical protein
VSAFYVPRSDPDKIDVNLRCLNDIDVSLLPVEEFEGRDWDEAIKTYRRDHDEE